MPIQTSGKQIQCVCEGEGQCFIKQARAEQAADLIVSFDFTNVNPTADAKKHHKMKRRKMSKSTKTRDRNTHRKINTTTANYFRFLVT